ncbi:Stp1/IreP family PP2C-type Ser/Thr phosphatase [Bacillus weihaiensis]|uniref:Stp1/IreP family PP2C-type Ser/Thr phosphatase n=1 Tax=Bacillus weihaiensis TaxID=1547283 RepID=UPI002356B625|nr:Stp1/IreP family PP2C-type Ser/Thr phosphatase [Bacillus weihaiensis]
MEHVFLTDRGKVRQHNEDSVSIFENGSGLLAIVADGMGGHLAGDVASQMTISVFKEMWNEAPDFKGPQEAESWLEEKVMEVNRSVFAHSRENSDCQGMGTTIVTAIVTQSFATIGHIGDSRCYILNKSGFKQITQDHSLVNELVKSGQISREDAEHHPRKNVLLRALGTEEHVELDIQTLSIEPDDIVLLCSDGLTNKLTDSVLEEELRKNDDLLHTAEKLVLMANENGGEDNISLAAIKKVANYELGEEPC